MKTKQTSAKSGAAKAVSITQSAILAGINDDRKALGWNPYKSYSAIEWGPSESVIRDAIMAALKTTRIKRLVEIAGMNEGAFNKFVMEVYYTAARETGIATAWREALGLSPARVGKGWKPHQISPSRRETKHT